MADDLDPSDAAKALGRLGGLKGGKASETFLRHDHARQWATDTKAQIDRGHAPSGRRARNAKTIGALIDLHIDDMKEVGKAPGRFKSAGQSCEAAVHLRVMPPVSIKHQASEMTLQERHSHSRAPTRREPQSRADNSSSAPCRAPGARLRGW